MTDPKKEGHPAADRIVLVIVLFLILIPVFLYLLAPEGADRINRLYFSGYVIMVASIFYTARAVRRLLDRQETPIIEKLLARPSSDFIPPQVYLNLNEQVRRSLKSRRYFQRILAPRLTAILRHRKEHERDFALLVNDGEPPERRTPAGRLWERLAGRGLGIGDLERTINALKEL